MQVFTTLYYNTFLVFTTIEKVNSSYERLDEEEKEKVRTVLYIMDRFSISFEGYHELSHTAVKRGARAQFSQKFCLTVLNFRKIFAFKPKVKTVAEKLSFKLRI